MSFLISATAIHLSLHPMTHRKHINVISPSKIFLNVTPSLKPFQYSYLHLHSHLFGFELYIYVNVDILVSQINYYFLTSGKLSYIFCTIEHSTVHDTQ